MIYGWSSWNSTDETSLLFEIKTLKSALNSFQSIDSIGSLWLTELAPDINLADSVTQNLYSNYCFNAEKYGTVFYGWL
jgi:hypothetical protein